MVHLPATNTPQFDWAASRLPRQPAPAGPIYQPELAARAIVWTLDHPRRQLYVGRTTVAALWAQRLVPGLADRYLARKAWEGQLGEEPQPGGRPGNLWGPVPGPWAAHGRFDDRASERSLQLAATTRRRPLAAVAALAALGGLLLRARRHG